MADAITEFELSYSGGLADRNEIDFYDVSQALVGFQRSLALTTHLVLTGEIITQAPALSGARILIAPPQDGSWKVTATVIAGLATSVYALGTAPRDTPLGNLVSSVYDYVISESLGVHVDYGTTLNQQVEALRVQGIQESKLDALVEKCEAAVKQMHRPMFASETADTADIKATLGGGPRPIGPPLTRQTFEYLAYTVESDRPTEYLGRISSYNINTFKGRIYVINESRPVPFELGQTVRDNSTVRAIINSLSENAEIKSLSEPNIGLTAFAYTSRTGRTKRLLVVGVRKITLPRQAES